MDDQTKNLLAKAFFLLQSFEITWHHEKEADDFWDNMGELAGRAYDLSKEIEPVINAAGTETVFNLGERTEQHGDG